MNANCHFCGWRPNPEPTQCKVGFYVECSACDEHGPVQPTKEQAWEGWNAGPFNPKRDAE